MSSSPPPLPPPEHQPPPPPLLSLQKPSLPEPDPGGPKTYGSYGSGSATLVQITCPVQEMDRYSLQESMSGADNEETMGSEDSATDPVITPPPPEVLYIFLQCSRSGIRCLFDPGIRDKE